MVTKIFWQNPYLTELYTTVKTINNNLVTLNETIFYAFSGGQESDYGTIGGYKVFEARKNETEIYYTIENSHNLKVGDNVKVIIDWQRRYRLMRLHFAAELVLEVVCHRFPEIIKVGAHIAENKSRIDFEWSQKISPFLVSIQQEVQNIINADQEITSAFSDEINERRFWKIKEFAEVPCGGTHIRRTSEVGIIKLKRENPGKGRERIEIYVD